MAKVFSKLQIFIQCKLSFIILLSLLFYGCLSVKPGASKSGKKYFETFYVGEEGTQYFIKPLLFENSESDKNLLLDIAFRYKKVIKDSAIVNFSIKSPILYKSIDSLVISNGNVEIRNNKIEHLFNEKTNKEFLCRFTTKISLDKINKIFNNDEWEFAIFEKNQMDKYKPHKKTEKAINILRDRLFILM